MNALLYALVHLLHTVISIYILIIIVAALLSFVRPDPNNPIVQVLYRLTDPIYQFIRKRFPFVVISGMDLSPLILLLALQFIDTFMMRAL